MYYFELQSHFIYLHSTAACERHSLKGIIILEHWLLGIKLSFRILDYCTKLHCQWI